jgi:hypothetical protein
MATDVSWTRVWLRLEGLFYLIVSVAMYAHLGGSWPRFAALFLLPDLSFAGYLAGPRVGAWSYNLLHSSIGPLALALLGLATAPGLLPLSCIWLAHVGADRALGYGLKQPTAFTETHLGPIGTARRAALA